MPRLGRRPLPPDEVPITVRWRLRDDTGAPWGRWHTRPMPSLEAAMAFHVIWCADLEVIVQVGEEPPPGVV